MAWFLFALLTAFFDSTKDVFSKKVLQNINEYVVTWSLVAFTAIFLIPTLFFIEIPKLGHQFWFALIAGGTLNTIAFLLFIKALKSADLSQVAPITTFTPLFLLITSPLQIGEFPNAVGFLGVVLIVIGSYVLNLKAKQSGYLAPFQSLLTEPGSRLVLFVAFIWSITANFDKIGIQNSSPIFWVLASFIWISLLITPIIFRNWQRNLQQIQQEFKTLVLMGFFNAITVAFQMTAVNLTLVAYVIAVKRTSALFSVAYGYLVFKEKGIKARLAGSVIMVLGVVFITLSQLF